MSTGLFPIFVRIERLAVLIVGGGRTGARRAEALLNASARSVTVVSPTFDDRMPREVKRIAEPFRPEHLNGQRLVFIATGSEEVNQAVARAAAKRRILFSRADDSAAGQFMTPPSGRAGDITWAIWSGVPALALRLSEEVQAIADKWSLAGELGARLRQLVRGRGTLQRRQALLADMATETALNLLEQHGSRALAAWMTARHPDFAVEIEAALAGVD